MVMGSIDQSIRLIMTRFEETEILSRWRGGCEDFELRGEKDSEEGGEFSCQLVYLFEICLQPKTASNLRRKLEAWWRKVERRQPYF